MMNHLIILSMNLMMLRILKFVRMVLVFLMERLNCKLTFIFNVLSVQ